MANLEGKVISLLLYLHSANFFPIHATIMVRKGINTFL